MTDSRTAQLGWAHRSGQTWAWLLVFLVTGTVLRLHMLGAKSLWGDEAFSVTVARMPFPEFVRTAWWGEANMTLYYLFLRVWVHLGETEFWLRSLSALLGVLTIAAVYLLGARFLSSKAGLVAGALLAVHAYHIRYSQELRSYTLVALLLILSTYAFLAALETPDRKVWWAAYGLLSALAIYAQVFAVFVLCSQWLVLTPGRIKRLGIVRLFTVGVAMGILAAPMAAVMVLQNKGQLDWVPRLNPVRILDVFQYMAGTEPLGTHKLARGLLLILYAATWIFSLVALFRPAPNQTEGNANKVPLQVLVLWFAFPIAAMMGLSFLKPILVPRYLLMCAPAAVLLAAQGLIILERRLPGGRFVSSAILVAMLGLAFISIRDYYATFTTYGHNWRAVTNLVLSQQELGDAAIFYTFSGHRVFDYYVGRERETNRQETTPDVLFPLALERANIENRAERHHRVWLILHQTIPTAETNKQTALIRSALQDHFRLAKEIEFPGAGATRDETGRILVALYISALADSNP
ncbi:MAG: glycosyltransferase family 39 protein [Candidatus Acidiferrum sp.]